LEQTSRQGRRERCLCHIAGAAVKVTHCQFIKPFPLDTVIDRRESRSGGIQWAVRDGAAVVEAPLEGGPRALDSGRVARSGRGGVHDRVIRVKKPASCLSRQLRRRARRVRVVVQIVTGT
jgi:hypothetical protein